MRGYKFRGKRLDNGEWVYGDLCHGPEGKCYIAYDQDFVDTCSCGINDLITDRFFEVDPETVGQYIGRKDKHDKEIYEHTTMTDGKITFEVKWNEFTCGFVAKGADINIPVMHLHLDLYEIVPELIP
jgi:uncharacterized phage protein (TIGR01671 family)